MRFSESRYTRPAMPCKTPAVARYPGRGRAREKFMSETLANYVVPAAIVAVAVVLVLGLVNMMRGGSPQTSQKLMRLRVLLQFVAVIIIMATIWAMGR
jgi:Hypoxia induced protein conserved region